MNQNLLIPKNFKFGGKTQAQLYNEAISKKQNDPPTPPKHIPPTHFNKAIPLIGSDGTTKKFTAMEALAEAKKQGKLLASLKDSDEYVLKNKGWFWTGDLIAYCASGQTLGDGLDYSDGNKVSYGLQIPKQFQHLTGETALILPYGNDSNQPNYEFTETHKNFWMVKILNPSAIIPTKIHRNDGYYKFDANLIPNGAALPQGSSADNTFRYFCQTGASYIGLLYRGGGGGRGVSAIRGPSGRRGVLVRGASI